MAFDASLYETIPQTNVAGTLALIRAVLTASHGVPLPAARKALHRVREAGEALRTQHQAVPPAKVENLTRAADAAVDRIWSAFAQRLAASIELGGADGTEAERVYGLLFAKGLTFLTLRYPEQWAEGDAILARIASENLEGTLDRLVGAPFLRELRARQAAYGEALGITKAKAAAPETVSLVEPLREARAALSTYARVLISAVENGDFDESAAVPMLAPLAALRTEEAVAVARDLPLQERVVLVEADDVDLRPRDRRQRRCEGELVTQRKVEVDGEDADVEVASGSSSARDLRAEEHGEAHAEDRKAASDVAHRPTSLVEELVRRHDGDGSADPAIEDVQVGARADPVLLVARERHASRSKDSNDSQGLGFGLPFGATRSAVLLGEFSLKLVVAAGHEFLEGGARDVAQGDADQVQV